MAINDRIKILRKTLKLNQTDFGRKIGLAANTIANYEIGRRAVSEQTIKSICREFNVSHYWLVDGEGDMFLPEPTGLIDELKVQYNLSDTEVEILENYLKLSKSQREDFMGMIKQLFRHNT